MTSVGVRCGVNRAFSLCLVVAALVAAPVPVWSQTGCFRYDEPLLFDTSDNPDGVPSNPRVLGVKLFHSGSNTYLFYNKGNEIAIRNVTAPQNPSVPRDSDFNVPPFGDRDYNLFNFDICDECRYGIAGYDAQGSVLFDVGNSGPTYPSFVAFHYYSDASGIGGVTFKQGANEYLVAKNLPGGCTGTPTLWKISGVNPTDLQMIGCVQAGTQAIGIDGGYRYSDSSGDYVIIADQSRKGYIFKIESGPSLVYTNKYIMAPTATGHGFASDPDAGLVVSAYSYVRIYDTSAGLDSLQLIAEWQPETAHNVSLVAMKFPFLWVTATAGQVYTYDISDPSDPQLIDVDFWAHSQPWNSYDFAQERDAIFTDDGHWMFVARFSVLQRFEVLDCLSTAPRATLSLSPTTAFPGDTVTVTNTSTSTSITESAIWITEEPSGTIVEGSGNMSAVEPTSRSLTVPIDLAQGVEYTAHVAVASVDFPCADPVGNPTACGEQVTMTAFTLDRTPQALVALSPAVVLTGETLTLDGSGTEGTPQSLLWQATLDGTDFPLANPTLETTSLTLDGSGTWRFDLTASYLHLDTAGGLYQSSDFEVISVSSVAADLSVATTAPKNTNPITLCFTGRAATDIAAGGLGYDWKVWDGSALMWSSSSCTTTSGCGQCGVVIPADTLPAVTRTYRMELVLTNNDTQHAGYQDQSTAEKSVVVSDGSVQLDFTFAPSNPDIGEDIIFSVSGIPMVDSASWNFGGSGCTGHTQSTTCTPSTWVDCMDQPYRYATSGSKTVSLSVVWGGTTYGPVVKTLSVSSAGTCGGSTTCTYTISPTSNSVGASGGTGSVSVTASAGNCTWNASTSSSWIHITSGASGTGSGTVNYSVDANTTCSTRSGTLSIAGKTHTVSQAAGSCPVDFSWTPANPQIGQTVTFTIVGGGYDVQSWSYGGTNCDNDTPTTDCTGYPYLCTSVQWEYKTSGSKTVTLVTNQGTKTKTVTVASTGSCPTTCTADAPPNASFSMSANPAVMGETVTFTDTSTGKVLAADFTWIPTSPEIGQPIEFRISGVSSITNAAWDFGGSGCSGYNQNTNCIPDMWMDCSSQPYKYAVGGTMTVSLRINGGSPVTKQITIESTGSCDAGPTCSYSVSPPSQSVPATGGTESVNVSTSTGCAWTAAANAGWLHVTSGSSGSGSGQVSYNVDANTGGARTGTLTIAGKTHTVSQAAGNGGTGGSNAPTAWQWTVKLGSTTVATSNAQSFSHLFETPGDYQVTMVASNCFASDTAVQTLEVREPGPEEFLVPAAAHAAGQNGTMWKTDLRVFNPSTESMECRVTFLPEATSNFGFTHAKVFWVLPNGTFVRGDVLEWICPSGCEYGKGTLHIACEDAQSAPLIMSRTYNDTPEGTYGQFVPAVPVVESAEGQLHLTGLIQNDYYRSNVGIANLRTEGVAGIVVTLLGEDGSTLGTTTAAIPAASSVQLVNVASLAGVTGDHDLFSVRIDLNGADLAAYASVVDNVTGDPVLYIPYSVGDQVIWLPGMAHLPGANDSLWRSDIYLFNPTGETLNANAIYVPDTWLGDQSEIGVTLPAGQAAFVVDVLRFMLGEVSTKGYLVIEGVGGSAVPQVAARTYNQTPDGTYGQNLKVFGAADLIQAGHTGYLPGLVSSFSFRTNVGLLNTDPDNPATVAMIAYDEDGTEIGRHNGFPLEPGQFKQLDNFFGWLGVTDDEFYSSVEVTVVSGGPVAAYASVVDNGTQDPILLPAQITTD